MSSTTQRLLAVLELLQSRNEITGSEIAERLEVDERSVRRYIKSLQDMGIPIETERGRYGGYRMHRGYKLPPMMFTQEEAVAITLGLMVIRAFRFPVDVMSVAGALTKVERVLPEPLLDLSMTLQDILHFNVITPVEIGSAVMKTLMAAMQKKNQLVLQYVSWQDEVTERMFDPYGIVFHEGWWYVAGYCHLRRELRTFRIDRIRDAELVEGTFAPPPDFDALAFVIRSLNDPAGIPPVEVLFMTSLEEAKRAIPAEFGTFEVVDEGVLFRRPAYRLEWVAPLLLSLDFPIRILQPTELKNMICDLGEKARKMVDRRDG